MHASDLSSLVRKLGSIGRLSEAEERALADLPAVVRNVGVQYDVVREGDQPSQSCMVVQGFVFASKLLGNGERQITSIYVPGDIPDLQSLHLQVMDMTVSTLTPCRLAFIPHEPLRRLCAEHIRLCFALWRSTLVDAAIYREWVASIGQRSALSRTAHLLCEILTRLRAVDLAADHMFDLPLNQRELADALGLSTVHMQRVIKDLRDQKLIELKDKRVVVRDWEELKRVGDFDAAYLHLRNEAAATA